MTDIQEDAAGRALNSCHSLLFGAAGQRSLPESALSAGEMVIRIDRYFEQRAERLYRPENKIAYLISQIASVRLYDLHGKGDVTRRLRRELPQVDALLRLVEKETGCSVMVDLCAEPPLYGVDPVSNGLGIDLLEDRDRLLDFLFFPEACIQLQRWNLPAWIETDIGAPVRTRPFLHVPGPVKGMPITLHVAQGKGQITICLGPEEWTARPKLAEFADIGSALRTMIITDVKSMLLRPTGFDVYGFYRDGGALAAEREAWDDPRKQRMRLESELENLIMRWRGDATTRQDRGHDDGYGPRLLENFDMVWTITPGDNIFALPDFVLQGVICESGGNDVRLAVMGMRDAFCRFVA